MLKYVEMMSHTAHSGTASDLHGKRVRSEVLSFVHSDASIVLHPQARLVVRNAAFYTPFRGWHQLDDVPYSERPPSITAVSCLSGSAIVVMDHLICEGLKYCLYNSAASHVTIKNSLFLENYEAIRDDGYYWSWSANTNQFEIERSVFFRNEIGTRLSYCQRCKVIDSLFLQNNIAMSARDASVWHSTFSQNARAMTSGDSFRLTDVLFYGNDMAFSANGVLQNITFLDNRLGLNIAAKVNGLSGINFLGLKEYHLHYTGTAIYDLDLSSTYWNTTSLDELEADIYDALDGSGAGVVQILGAESMPDAPFHHGMYQEDLCAGQCNQHWFNKNWSSLISGGAGTFGFFDPERSLNSGQVLREALLTGHETPSSMSLSSYMQDVAGLLEAVGAFQTVGTTTSPLPSTTPSTTSTTTTTTTTLAAHLIRGADIVLTEPMWIKQNTTWTSDGIRALAKKVEVLPGVTLTIEGARTSLAVLPSETYFLFSAVALHSCVLVAWFCQFCSMATQQETC